MSRNLGILFGVLTLLISAQAQSQEQIQRPYASPRVTAMGGVLLATGMWDDNFYGNPALVAANPRLKIRLIDIPMLEVTLPAVLIVPKIMGGGDLLSNLSGYTGTPLHVRVQTAFPTFFVPARGERKWGIAFGLTTSTQFDAILRESYQGALSVHSDAAFHVSFARKFLPGDLLLLGTTVRLAYRLSGNPSYSVLDYFQGHALSLLASGGDGAMVDGDIGALFRIPFKIAGAFDLSVGTALNNIVGGGYSNLPLSILGTGTLPVAQPRQWGIGVALRREIWGVFKESQLALDLQDIGNTGGGSLFRLLHLGAETRWRFLIARAGVNQGYLTAGLGVYFRFLTLDLSTYGEEVGLNSGSLESRRFAVRAGIQIVN